jgi:hypothetical protein
LKVFKRDLGLIVSTAIVVSGLFLMNNTLNEEEYSSTIIKVDEKTEIRIIEGTKYRCTLINK